MNKMRICDGVNISPRDHWKKMIAKKDLLLRKRNASHIVHLVMSKKKDAWIL